MENTVDDYSSDTELREMVRDVLSSKKKVNADKSEANAYKQAVLLRNA